MMCWGELYDCRISKRFGKKHFLIQHHRRNYCNSFVVVTIFSWSLQLFLTMTFLFHDFEECFLKKRLTFLKKSPKNGCQKSGFEKTFLQISMSKKVGRFYRNCLNISTLLSVTKFRFRMMGLSPQNLYIKTSILNVHDIEVTLYFSHEVSNYVKHIILSPRSFLETWIYHSYLHKCQTTF